MREEGGQQGENIERGMVQVRERKRGKEIERVKAIKVSYITHFFSNCL